jgi:toxin-antitoxin system PIN domain toxin
MIVPDANLLLYAYDTTSPFHAKAKPWWEQCLSGVEPVGLTHPVVFAFLRIATHTRAFVSPLPLSRADAIVREWLEAPPVQVLLPGPDHLQRTLHLLEQAASAGGNLVTDAQIAALADACRATVHTADGDFRRFKTVKTCYPLDA